jgi:DoxX-like protein
VNLVLWIVAGVLAFGMLASGGMKVVRPKAQLATSGQAWVEDFSDSAVKGIGTLEVLAALGLVLPALLDIAPILVPLAAAGVFVLMIGATITHARRKEFSAIPITVTLAVLGLFIAVFRFGPYSF